MPYSIVKARYGGGEDPTVELQRKVNELMQDGWQPLGAPWDNRNTMELCQSMSRSETIPGKPPGEVDLRGIGQIEPKPLTHSPAPQTFRKKQ